jgi:hypothetical protein
VDDRRESPGVDHGRAGAGALAQEVDAVVAERHARGLEVVDLLRETVAGEVHALVREPLRACSVGTRVRAERRLAEGVGRVLERRLDLRAVEPDGAVDAAIADEDDVPVADEAAHLGEPCVRQARAALEVEDRFGRMIGLRTDSNDRQRDQSRAGVRPVLGHYQRSAVRRITPVLGGEAAGTGAQFSCRGSGRHRHLLRDATEAQVDEPDDDDRDEPEGDHSGRP